MKLYLAGPVSAHKDHNLPRFNIVRDFLISQDYEVVIPHDHVPSTASHDEAMAICLPLLDTVDGIALIDRWWTSPGTLIEMGRGIELGKQIRPWTEWL